MNSIARFIDHTILKANATQEQISALCMEAKENGFYAVCVNPVWVSYAFSLLQGTGVKVCAVVGFPLGASAAQIKAVEAALAVQDGAQEIDMVINVGGLKSGKFSLIANEIVAVRSAIPDGVYLKVILETYLLTDEEKIAACKIAVDCGANCVKTSTGFSTDGNTNQGATVHDVELMRETVGPNIGVKAGGGISTAEDAQKMIDAGATRIGTSKGVKIVSPE